MGIMDVRYPKELTEKAKAESAFLITVDCFGRHARRGRVTMQRTMTEADADKFEAMCVAFFREITAKKKAEGQTPLAPDFDSDEEKRQWDTAGGKT